MSRLSKASSVLLLAMVAAAETTNTERTHIAVRLELAMSPRHVAGRISMPAWCVMVIKREDHCPC